MPPTRKKEDVPHHGGWGSEANVCDERPLGHDHRERLGREDQMYPSHSSGEHTETCSKDARPLGKAAHQQPGTRSSGDGAGVCGAPSRYHSFSHCLHSSEGGCFGRGHGTRQWRAQAHRRAKGEPIGIGRKMSIEGRNSVRASSATSLQTPVRTSALLSADVSCKSELLSGR